MKKTYLLLTIPFLLCSCGNESSGSETDSYGTLPNSSISMKEVIGDYIDTRGWYPLSLKANNEFSIDVDGEIQTGTYHLERINYSETIDWSGALKNDDNYGSDEVQVFRIIFSKIEGLSPIFSYGFAGQEIPHQFLKYYYSRQQYGVNYFNAEITSQLGGSIEDEDGNFIGTAAFNYHLLLNGSEN